MSAFVVDKSDIDRLVRAAAYAHESHYPGDRRQMQWWRVDEQGGYAGWNKLDELAETRAGDDYMQYVTPSYLGQILVSENVASVAYRYEAYYMGPYVYADPREDLTPGAVFELIDRLDYQSCEHPGWRTSEAYAFCVALRKAYCDRVIYAESAAQCREP